MARTRQSDLPAELMERILSFLPVPSVCRCRTVCKQWNDLTRKPAFHDLHDRNTRPHRSRYLFVARHATRAAPAGQPAEYRLGILDRDAHRWYTIPTHAYSHGPPFEPRLQAMDTGLICELSRDRDPTPVVVSDPVAATRRELPPIPEHRDLARGAARKLVVATTRDPIACTYGIAVLIHFHHHPQLNCVWLYASSTNAWRSVAIPQQLIVQSAVFFRHVLYVIFTPSRRSGCANTSFHLLTLNLDREEKWGNIPVSLPRQHYDHPHPRLVVSGGRLCMIQWIAFRAPNESLAFEYAQFFDTFPANSMLEIVEIVVLGSELHHSTRSLVRMTGWCGEESNQIACAIPVFWGESSGDSLRSLVVMSKLSGKVVRCDMASGVLETLPAHPFGPVSADPDMTRYFGNLTSLSLRSVTL